tara:strand:- start:189 stop:830 length:642 start_codon:yes stop_codon:yes gene_type:complete
MTTTEPAVFVVDDDSRSRESVQAMVGSMNLKAHTFASAEEFLDRYSGEPGCLVTDLRMPGRNAVELIDALRERGFHLPAIVITAYADVPVTVEAMQRGAITLLEKPYRGNDLWNAIRFAIQQATESQERFEERRAIQARLDQLTAQEKSVMGLVIDGAPSKTIARRLDMGIRTVEARRRSILDKMHVDSFTRLAQDIVIANDGQRPDGVAPNP